jgi:hypothetical protein
MPSGAPDTRRWLLEPCAIQLSNEHHLPLRDIMSDLPLPETDDPRERDHGELFRPSPRHLAVGPLKPGDRNFLLGLLAAAAVTVALVSLAR